MLFERSAFPSISTADSQLIFQNIADKDCVSQKPNSRPYNSTKANVACEICCQEISLTFNYSISFSEKLKVSCLFKKLFKYFFWLDRPKILGKASQCVVVVVLHFCLQHSLQGQSFQFNIADINSS
jgi:hypothetical protein